MDKSVCIFSGGELGAGTRIEVNKSDFIICADSGYRHASALGITPDCIIGDFDSVDSVYSGLECEKICFPKEKDDTDTMLAVKLAIERGYKNITIYGALGGRFDHSFANIGVLLYAHKNGADAKITSGSEDIYVQGTGSRRYTKKNRYFSVFALTEKVTGVTLTGTKYPLSDYTLNFDFPIGVSNEILAAFCTLEISEGILLVVNA